MPLEQLLTSAQPPSRPEAQPASHPGAQPSRMPPLPPYQQVAPISARPGALPFSPHRSVMPRLPLSACTSPPWSSSNCSDDGYSSDASQRPLPTGVTFPQLAGNGKGRCGQGCGNGTRREEHNHPQPLPTSSTHDQQSITAASSCRRQEENSEDVAAYESTPGGGAGLPRRFTMQTQLDMPIEEHGNRELFNRRTEYLVDEGTDAIEPRVSVAAAAAVAYPRFEQNRRNSNDSWSSEVISLEGSVYQRQPSPSVSPSKLYSSPGNGRSAANTPDGRPSQPQPWPSVTPGMLRSTGGSIGSGSGSNGEVISLGGGLAQRPQSPAVTPTLSRVSNGGTGSSDQSGEVISFGGSAALRPPSPSVTPTLFGRSGSSATRGIGSSGRRSSLRSRFAARKRVFTPLNLVGLVHQHILVTR